MSAPAKVPPTGPPGKAGGGGSGPLTKKVGDPYVPAEKKYVLGGQYPLSRYLYVYINKAPNKPVNPLELVRG